MNAVQRYPGRGTIARPLEQTVEKRPNEASLAYERQVYSNEELVQEEWRPITGYENTYFISTLGRVKKHSGLRDTSLGAWIHHRGFSAIELVNNGHRKNFLVHRLMALVFMPGTVSVGHRDGNKLNNKLSNLFPKDTHRQAPSVPLAKLNALLSEFNGGSQKRGQIKQLATKYAIPWLVARRFVAKHSSRSTTESTILSGEEWKPIPNYEGLYEVSCMGRVKRIAHKARVGWLKEKQINGRINRDGYHVTPLTIEGQTKGIRVHRAVAMAFIPNPGNLPEVNHKDGNKLNNQRDNLEWSTSFDNKVHAWKTGLYPRKSKHSPLAF